MVGVGKLRAGSYTPEPGTNRDPRQPGSDNVKTRTRLRVPPVGVALVCCSALLTYLFQVDMEQWWASTEHILEGEWWRLLTGWLAHQDVWHLGFNLWAIGVFGWHLERNAGWGRFLVVFLGGVAAGNLAETYTTVDPVVVLGASGGTYALAGVWLTLSLRRMFTPLGGKILGLMLLFFFSAAAVQIFVEDVAWWAHVGGVAWGGLCQVVVPKPVHQRVAKPSKKRKRGRVEQPEHPDMGTSL